MILGILNVNNVIARYVVFYLLFLLDGLESTDRAAKATFHTKILTLVQIVFKYYTVS
jgi:hypothetical protein